MASPSGADPRSGDPATGADAANVRARALLAECYETQGLLHWTRAESSKEANARRASVREARRWYVRARDAYLALQAQGRLTAASARQLAVMKRSVARCDAALRDADSHPRQ